MLKGKEGEEVARNFGDDFRFVSTFKGFGDKYLLYLISFNI